MSAMSYAQPQQDTIPHEQEVPDGALVKQSLTVIRAPLSSWSLDITDHWCATSAAFSRTMTRSMMYSSMSSSSSMFPCRPC